MPHTAALPPFAERGIVANLGTILRSRVALAAERAARAIGQPVATAELPPGWLPQLSNGALGEPPSFDQTKALQAATSHVYAAVHFNEKSMWEVASTTELRAERKGKDPTPLEEHYLLDTLRRPNDVDVTGEALLGRVCVWLDLAGNAYLAKVRDGAGRVVGLWPLLPSHVRIVAGREAPIGGFNFYPDGGMGRVIGFKREDVVFVRLAAPGEYLYGYSPLRAASLERDIHEQGLRLRWHQYQNFARPDYVLGPELPQGKEREPALRRFYARLLIHHQGVDKAGLPLVVPKGTDLHTLGFSSRDLEFVEQSRMTRDDILAIFGVPAILVGHGESGTPRANYEAAIYSHARHTLKPLASLIYAALQADLVEEVNRLQPPGVRLCIGFTWDVPVDRTEQRTEATEGFKAGLLSRDEGRRRLGEAPIDGTKPVFVDPNRKPEPFGGQPPAKSVPERITKCGTVAAVRKATALDLSTEEKRADYWRKAIAPQDAETKRGTRVFRAYFRSQAARVVPEIEAALPALGDKFAGWSRPKVLKWFATHKDETTPIPWDGKRERRELLDVVLPFVSHAADEGAEHMAELIGLDFDLDSPTATRWLNGHAVQVTGDVLDFTRAALGDVVRDGVADGHSAQEIARSLRETFRAWEGDGADGEGAMPGYRAARIARTETSAAFGYAQDQVLREAVEMGIAEGSEWVTARDGYVRAEHEIDGEVRAPGERFSNGMLYPGDQSVDPSLFVNDRCTTAPKITGG